MVKCFRLEGEIIHEEAVFAVDGGVCPGGAGRNRRLAGRGGRRRPAEPLRGTAGPRARPEPSAAAVHAAFRMGQRSERPDVAERRMALLLPAQPHGNAVGKHALGLRRLDGPRPLGGAEARSRAGRDGDDVQRLGRGGPGEHGGLREGRTRPPLHRRRGEGEAVHAVSRVFARRAAVREVCGQPHHPAAVAREPRPEGVLARADARVGDGALRGGERAARRLDPHVARPEDVDETLDRDGGARRRRRTGGSTNARAWRS